MWLRFENDPEALPRHASIGGYRRTYPWNGSIWPSAAIGRQLIVVVGVPGGVGLVGNHALEPDPVRRKRRHDDVAGDLQPFEIRARHSHRRAAPRCERDERQLAIDARP